MTERDKLLHAVGEPPFLGPQDLSWRTVRLIALHSAPVKAAIVMAEKNGWTREQALVLAVYALAEHAASLTDKAVEAAQNQPASFLIEAGS